MLDFIEDMITNLWHLPRGVKAQYKSRKHPGNFQHYRRWGYVIYRTYYGPGSDKYWNMLLDALRRQTMLAFGFFEDDEDSDQGDVQRLKELFFLDAREDPEQLDGLNVVGIRNFCNKTLKFDKHGCMANDLYHHVLLADESVIKDIAKGEFIVKAVALKWREGFPTWGWIRIPTGYLLELWQRLIFQEDDPETALCFNGPEEDLNDYVWPGDMGADGTGCCSEIRDGFFHYTGQWPDRSY